MDKLKPCPFFVGESLIYCSGSPENKEFSEVICKKCKYSTDIYNTIKNSPSADVAPVQHGRWMEWFPGDCALIMTGEEMLYRCSLCDAKYADTEGYKYCPNCGARMDLEVTHD